mmetsp:Transcript_51635/g.110692  ORF Transcript_51635/g.110692 Transcript_51635/m.110692 type:complete len:281 (-) Transcript_51635:551-1393(-)
MSSIHPSRSWKSRQFLRLLTFRRGSSLWTCKSHRIHVARLGGHSKSLSIGQRRILAVSHRHFSNWHETLRGHRRSFVFGSMLKKICSHAFSQILREAGGKFHRRFASKSTLICDRSTFQEYAEHSNALLRQRNSLLTLNQSVPARATRSKKQRRIAVPVPSRWISPNSDQRIHVVPQKPSCRVVQWSPTVLICGVDVGAARLQVRKNLNALVNIRVHFCRNCSKMRRGHLVLISSGGTLTQMNAVLQCFQIRSTCRIRHCARCSVKRKTRQITPNDNESQ